MRNGFYLSRVELYIYATATFNYRLAYFNFIRQLTFGVLTLRACIGQVGIYTYITYNNL